MTDEHADHEKCERCEGCVPCGCICHLAGDSGTEEDPEEGRELVELEMGLREYEGETQCPKCGSTTVQVVFHPTVVVAMGDELFACQEWIMEGLLTPNTSQHLCMRCLRCRYGWPTKTRDA